MAPIEIQSETDPANDKQTHAPWLAVSPDAVVSIEHPCIISNIDNAIQSLGGKNKLDKFLKLKDRNKTIGASLRPSDTLAKPLMSNLVKTQNIVLKITVPKRTGRKRKRGSNEPFEFDSQEEGCAAAPLNQSKILLQALRDNPDSYSIHPIGHVEETHRFRSLPDFQYSTSTDPLMTNLRHNIMQFNYPKFKDFKLDLSEEAQAEKGVGPPPDFSVLDIPVNYQYRQNPLVQFVQDRTGRATAVNTRKNDRPIMQTVAVDVESVPLKPHLPLEPEESLDSQHQTALRLVRAELEERPIISRRVLANRLPSKVAHIWKHVLPYVGFKFAAGPWKDALIKYGIDPRADPKYRIYQTMMFKLFKRGEKKPSANAGEWMGETVNSRNFAKDASRNQESHVFDGRKVIPDGRVWQICDITDPIIKRIFETVNLRSECHASDPRFIVEHPRLTDRQYRLDGWYHNGTLAKAQVIMKDKAAIIRKGGTPNDADYRRVIDMPDIIDPDTLDYTQTRERLETRDRDIALALEVRRAVVEAARAQQRTDRAKEVLREESAPTDAQPDQEEGAATEREGLGSEEEDELDAESEDGDDDMAEDDDDDAPEDDSGADEEEVNEPE